MLGTMAKKSKQKVTMEVLEEIMKAQGLLIQPWHGSFMVISLDDVMHGRDPTSCWMWAFVNKEKKRYDLRFETFEQFREALLDSPELCHGTYPREAIPNPWYQKNDEQILLMRDIFKGC